jgi:hypothetical protein
MNAQICLFFAPGDGRRNYLPMAHTEAAWLSALAMQTERGYI